MRSSLFRRAAVTSRLAGRVAVMSRPAARVAATFGLARRLPLAARSVLFAACCLLSTAHCLSQEIDRTKPPETPPLPAYKLPPLYETKLANGLAVVLVEDNRFPLVTVRLGFAAGSKVDPPDLPGLAESTGALLREGTKSRTSRQIAEELAAIGGAVSQQVTPDSLILAGNALAENADKLLELVADMARSAGFPADEVQLRKQNRKQSLLARLSQADFQAEIKLDELLFGSHPYARTHPTVESIDRLDQAHLAGFRDRYLVPNNAVLILLGQLPRRDEALKWIEQRFSGWEKKPLPAPPAAPSAQSGRRFILVDRPGSVQADIRVGRLAVTRESPDYFPLMVGNSILGAGASSRMFTNIREKKGFAYDAHSEMHPLKDAGFVAAVTQVRNEVVGPALEAVVSELQGMAAKPVEASELSDVKNLLSGFFVLRLESQSGLAGQLATVKTLGLPNNYLETYTTRIRSVEPDQIQAAARKYLSPEQAAIVVVGDAQQIGPALEKFGKAEIIKAK